MIIGNSAYTLLIVLFNAWRWIPLLTCTSCLTLTFKIPCWNWCCMFSLKEFLLYIMNVYYYQQVFGTIESCLTFFFQYNGSGSHNHHNFRGRGRGRGSAVCWYNPIPVFIRTYLVQKEAIVNPEYCLTCL